MSKRRLSFDIPTTTPNRVLEAVVTYDEGGANYFTGGTKRRGFYLAMHVIEITPPVIPGGYGGRKSILFSRDQNGGCFLEEAKRFNAKRLQALFDGIRERPEFSEIRDRLLAANNLTLAEEQAAA